MLKSIMRELPEKVAMPGGKPGLNKILPILIVVLASLSVYSNSLHNGFVWDDHTIVLDNQWIRSPRNLPAIFTSDEWAFNCTKTNFYRPLVHVAYMAEYAVFRLRPWGFHLVNVLLHAANSAMVFLLALYFLEAAAPALIAALLFAVHPLHTEAVDWTSGILDLMSTFFLLLSLLLFILGKNRLLNSFIFFLGLLSKEIAFCFPLLAFICPCYGKDNSVKDRLKRISPFIATAALYLGLRAYALGSFVRVNWRPELSHWQVFINIFALFGQYIWKLILPIGLHAAYRFSPASSILDWRVIAGALAIALFAATTLRSRMMRVPGAIFILALLPVLFLTVIPVESVMADRYVYLPSVGFLIIVTGWIWKFFKGRKAAKAVLAPLAAGLIVFYAAETFTHNPVWKNDYTLWSDAVKKSPNWLAYHNLGRIYIRQGMYDKAIVNLQTALKAIPNTPELYYNLADVYAMAGNPAAALATVEKASQTGLPENAEYALHLADALRANGRLDDSMAQYKRAIQMDPKLTFAYHNLNIIYVQEGRIGEAMDNLRYGIRANPGGPKLRYDLAKIYALANRPADAMNELGIAEKMEPDSQVYKTIGDFFDRQGQGKWAQRAYRDAAGISPDLEPQEGGDGPAGEQ